jgi:hypothetical protein
MGAVREDDSVPGILADLDRVRALDALRFTWGDLYGAGWDLVNGWWYRRRDGLSGLVRVAGPIDLTGHDQLAAAIAADHAFRPVRLEAQ